MGAVPYYFSAYAHVKLTAGFILFVLLGGLQMAESVSRHCGVVLSGGRKVKNLYFLNMARLGVGRRLGDLELLKRVSSSRNSMYRIGQVT